MGLLTTVEQEFMLKTGKLPKVTKAIDWRNEFDPKKYKHKAQKQKHETTATFVETELSTKKEKKDKKRSKKKKQKHAHPQTATNIAYSATAAATASFAPYRKHKAENSATASSTMAHEQRWSGFALGASGDEEPEVHDFEQAQAKGSSRSNKSKGGKGPKHRDKP